MLGNARTFAYLPTQVALTSVYNWTLVVHKVITRLTGACNLSVHRCHTGPWLSEGKIQNGLAEVTDRPAAIPPRIHVFVGPVRAVGKLVGQ
jgi:hypothetical protein